MNEKTSKYIRKKWLKNKSSIKLKKINRKKINKFENIIEEDIDNLNRRQMYISENKQLRKNKWEK